MPVSRKSLRWIPESISTILHINGIETREDLAKVAGVGINTIYRCFPKNAESEWAGEATTLTLYALAYAFDVPLNCLVYEPKSDREQKARRQKRSA